MGIDQFTKEEFEAALPVDKVSGEPLWEHLGLQDGEHVYAIPVARKDDAPVRVIIRSSVGYAGKAHDTGQDSIRVWLEAGYIQADFEKVRWSKKYTIASLNVRDLKPGEVKWISVGKGASRWTTRMPGWADRLTPLLRELYMVAMKDITRCPICHNWRVFRKVKKKGPNKGRFFTTCIVCDNQFRWVKT